MRLYHGTTAEAYKIITENGFSHSKVVWTCSDPNVLYFYRHDLVAKEYALDEQDAIKKCFELALESASCTAAITNSASSNLFVYEFLIAHTNIVMPDTSTGNVDDYCVCIDTELLNVLPHNVYCAPAHYVPNLVLHYLSSLLQKDYMPKLNLTYLEELVIKNVITPGVDLFQSTMYDFLSQSTMVMVHENICTAHAGLKVCAAGDMDQLDQSLNSQFTICQY